MNASKGCIHVYTGDGKGKTCAALGMIVRATGAGMRVFVGQFLKSGETCELKTLAARFPDVTVETYGTGKWVKGRPSDDDIAAARKGLERLSEALVGGGYGMAIADEAVVAAQYGMIAVAELLALCDAKPAGVELIFTGRNAPEELIRRADLVTEMRCVKHYHDRGTPARKGIEM